MKNIKIIRHMPSVISSQAGFTYLEAILYIGIITIMLNALVPFAWNIIETSSKSSTQQEVSSQARYLSERFKKEIRDASSITTCNATTLTMANSDSTKNPTTFSFGSNQITITQGTAIPSALRLHSNDTAVTAFNCTNYTGTGTDNVQITFTMTDNFNSARSEFSDSISLQFSAETRN